MQQSKTLRKESRDRSNWQHPGSLQQVIFQTWRQHNYIPFASGNVYVSNMCFSVFPANRVPQLIFHRHRQHGIVSLWLDVQHSGLVLALALAVTWMMQACSQTIKWCQVCEESNGVRLLVELVVLLVVVLVIVLVVVLCQCHKKTKTGKDHWCLQLLQILAFLRTPGACKDLLITEKDMILCPCASHMFLNHRDVGSLQFFAKNFASDLTSFQ